MRTRLRVDCDDAALLRQVGEFLGSLAGRDLAAPLTAVGLFDRYQGKGVPEGAVSLSIRLTFQAAERTLTDAEVQKSVETILAALIERHAAVQR